ncbi:type III-B CRISPR module-associated protein Cmr5 [Aliarcobacter butzleri]|uniref:type III-B CRISPR module-associated protein Cmr5 n=1 Tax=Aliarcobacter butzleri TaxID=28197 RepID=UPI003B22466C
MYNKNLEKLIPITLNIIENHKKNMFAENSNKIKSEFNGYFASFGPSVLMAGLNQTVMFFDDKDKKDKKLVNTIIFEILKEMKWDENKQNLKDLVLEYNPLIKSRVLEVVTSCKLAIRTFELKD